MTAGRSGAGRDDAGTPGEQGRRTVEDAEDGGTGRDRTKDGARADPPPLRRGTDGHWLPPWGNTSDTEPPPDRVDVVAAPGFVDALAASRPTLLRRPHRLALYGLAAAGLVTGAMTAQDVVGSLVGTVVGPVTGLAAFRLLLLPWHRSRFRSQWSFTDRGLTERRTGPDDGGVTTRLVRPWSHVERLDVTDRTVVVVLREGTTAVLPRRAFGAGELTTVIGWARRAGALVNDARAGE